MRMLLVPGSISRRFLLLVFLLIAIVIFFSSESILNPFDHHQHYQSPYSGSNNPRQKAPHVPVDVSVVGHVDIDNKPIDNEPIMHGSTRVGNDEKGSTDVEDIPRLTLPAPSTLLSTSSHASMSTTITTATPHPRPPSSHNSLLYPPPNHLLPALNPLVIPPTSSSPPPATPLFIGYTRNYPILQQCILAYLTSGWPAGQIYIVDNTGTMDSNKRNLLSSENPFYLPYKHLTEVLGVNIITTPALLTFSQLQNFFISTATEKGWSRFFWSHMDAVPLSYEDQVPFISIYGGILEVLTQIDFRAPHEPENREKWALKFFAYDRLTLVNVETVVAVGAWDTLIPFYYSDCDFYSRVRMHGYTIQDHDVGYIFDVADTLNDLSFLFPGGYNGKFPELSPDIPINNSRWWALRETLLGLEQQKNTNTHGRNYWQARQRGGEGEPFFRDMEVFETEIQRLVKLGEGVFRRKWGLKLGVCDLDGEGGKGLKDMWKGLSDVDEEEEE